MFYILEIQKSADGSYAHIVQTASTYNDAMSEYHKVLMYAAKSGLPLHTASLINEIGEVIVHEDYRHTQEPVQAE